MDVAELGAADALRQTGTHSILGITGVVDENQPDVPGALRPLRAEEPATLFRHRDADAR